jgi:hypothetical protein
MFILSIFSKTVFSLDTNSLKYMPLQVGNYWVYTGYTSIFGGGTSYWTEKFSVVFTRSINNHIYYYLNSGNNDLFKGYYRIDSTTGTLYKYDSTGSCQNYHNEILIDSLAAISGDSIRNCNSGSYCCTGTSDFTIFGITSTKKSFNYVFYYFPFTIMYDKIFIKNLGFYNYSSSSTGGGGGGACSLTLKGCKINGIVYGDTSMTKINQINKELPNDFSLSQNYPNPFNPTTSIKYQVESRKLIKLVVYDILGKEVAVLVNEKLQPGTYETQFPNYYGVTGNQLPSGVYFYSLFADGERMDTKKMLMIK